MFQRSRRCSFCGKSEADVVKLVAGPRVFICDACMALAGKLMEESSSGHPARAPESGLWRRVWHRIRQVRRVDGWPRSEARAMIPVAQRP